MAETSHVIASQEYEEVPEEVVETSYMCGECFLLFPTTEDFSSHQCQIAEVENVGNQEDPEQEPSTSCVKTGVWDAGESEAAVEEAVASILGERMKRTAAPQRSNIEVAPELKHTLIISEDSSIEHHIDPVLQPVEDDMVQIELERNMEGVEIPSTNLYVYDNASYLHKLMKDNTFGRRVRHDAPYTHRLGPWDNKSSRFLIQLLKEYPKAYFIMDKEMKRTEAWEMIRLRLSEASYQFTVLQIRMRWRELCKKYRNTVNHNDLHNTRKTCQYMDDLNNLFGVWDKGATLLLIRQLDTNCRKGLGQNGGTRMRIRVWEHIRQVLAAHGYQYTPDQVQGRWSNLVTLYQRMVEHNSKPHNEHIVIAFKEHIERIFNYVPERNSKWLKIMEKRGKTPKPLTKRWTLPVERILLAGYQERVYRFNNEHVHNNELWREIVQKIKEEGGYESGVEKVRTRFYELTKQFSITEQHNSQPGTIRRECRHHHTLTQIYSVYNYWPHDKSTIKLEKSNAIRMRQVNAQLGWSEEQSRMLLQLYPQLLVSHLSSGEHQPIEELWLQLAKAYMNALNDRKQCYELEEHLWLLRRGHHSHNPFPFTGEMQQVEETEATLGFVAGQQHQAGVNKHQLVPYWSHPAAHLLLDLLLHYRQEGIKNAVIFEMISTNMASYGYRYTGEECRTYYTLLRQLYTNRLRTIKRNKELIKPFPYMDKMAEVDAILSQPKFAETEENHQIIKQVAQERVVGLRVGPEEGKEEGGDNGQSHLLNWLTNLKMALKRVGLRPAPPIKCLARILSAVIENPPNSEDSSELFHILGPQLKLLQSIAERGGSFLVYQPTVVKSKGKKATPKNVMQQKYSSVQWNEENLHTMLSTVKEWKLLCHDEEFEELVVSGGAMWKEVASRVGEYSKVDPAKCEERFNQLCREYRSVVSFNTRLGVEEGSKSVPCQKMLETILMPLICHQAELDVRDTWRASEETRDWTQQETVELLFTVRELWPSFPKDGWEVVSAMMGCSGHRRGGQACRNRFDELYAGYQAADQHNQHCSLRTRRRPPFYYKIHSLFSSLPHTQPVAIKVGGKCEIEVEEREVLCVLVRQLRQMKLHHCHSLPRLPLLLALAQHLNNHFQCSPLAFTPFKVWELMVQMHWCQMEGQEAVCEELVDLWQKHLNPLVAYGLHANPHPGWQQVCEWSAEEVLCLLEGIINWELQPRTADTLATNNTTSACHTLRAQGHHKTPTQCQSQWLYILATLRIGGYKQFMDQFKLLFVISASLMHPQKLQLGSHNLQKAESPRVKICAGHSQTKNKDHKIGRHNINKLRVNVRDSAVLTVSEENWERQRVKNSAPGDVISYVQINIPWKAKPNKRHVQVATEEPEVIKRSEEEGVFEASLAIKKEPEDDTSFKFSCKDSATYMYKKRQKLFAGKQAITQSCSKIKTVNGNKSICDLNGKQSDRVQVEILSIAKSERSKVVECRTVQGVVPARTIRLHYPSDHLLPPSLKHMNIPMIMVYPDLMATGKELKLSQSPGETQSYPLNLKLEVEEDIVQQTEVPDSLELDESQCVEPGRREVLDLLIQYREKCQEDRKRWLASLQYVHHQHITLLKQALSIFKEVHDCL